MRGPGECIRPNISLALVSEGTPEYQTEQPGPEARADPGAKSLGQTPAEPLGQSLHLSAFHLP